MIENKEKNFISAVVYMNNVEHRIQPFLERLVAVLADHFEKFEIICVNDSSTDESVKKVKEFSQHIAGSVLTIINMSYYQGLEVSMKAGVDFSIGDFVYEFDCIDMDYQPSLILDVYLQSLKGFDIVSAAANTASSKSSALFYKLFNKSASGTYSLQTETFRILSRRGINRAQSVSKTIPYRKAIYANCGLNLFVVRYVPIVTEKHKVSKALKAAKYNVATTSLVLFTDLAYKFSLFMALVFLLSAFCVIAYAIIIFISQEPIAGWTTIMLFLAFSFFGVFSFFAIIVKYLSILIDLVFKKQDYLIQSVEKITRQ